MTTFTFRRILRAGLLAGCSLVAVSTAAYAQDTTTAAAASSDDNTVVTILGSRIPRTKKEGPAPVTTITADQIRAGGYGSVPDVLRTVSQNSGETQSQQSYSGADFAPGSAQVDLRGLGSNHTLVLVNGRRIADFPMPYGGLSNFTDVSNIPIGMVDRVEILSGAASAVYGSDAIAGVVNFKLKDHADGTTLDYRYGWEEHGGGMSHKLSGSTGWDSKDGKFHAVIGGELLHKDPVWGYQRSWQDSTDDNPDPDRRYARRNYLREDNDENYVDPGQSQCDALSGQNMGSTIRDFRPNWGFYCGSRESEGYGTIESKRDQLSAVGYFTYDYNDNTHFFADVQFAHSQVALFKDVLEWYYEDPTTGDESGWFFNVHPNALQDGNSEHDGGNENWDRLFSPEEMGGLKNGMRTINSNIYSVTPGVTGTFGADNKWTYEVSVNLAKFQQRIKFPLVIIDKANALFLGPQLGVDNDPQFLDGDGYGFPVFSADPARLYKPLTQAEYDSITGNSIYKPQQWLVNFSATVGTRELFQMPAGPVGFSLVVEGGRQGYNLNPDDKATGYYYLSWKDSDGHGGRDHEAIGTEFTVPLLSQLQLDLAGRYDTFDYAGNNNGKFTYNTGLEFRPVKSLLLRAAYGTAFRAPDLHYVYTGPGVVEGGGDDYYLCRTLEPGTDLPDCDYSDSHVFIQRNGNLKLKPETADSLTAGFVWQPISWFDMSADYFRINMKNQVEDMDVNSVLRDEADCRIGQTEAGTAVSITSPTCVDALARVHRFVGGASDGEINSVDINPINIAGEKTSGLDLSAHVRFATKFGKFGLTGNYTHVYDHTFTQFAGDTPLNKFAVDSDFYIPRDKGSASVNWQYGKWKVNVDADYISRLPNYDEDAFVASYTTLNGSVEYDVNDHVQISLAIDNLTDKRAPHDPTWVSYPYYYSAWYDGSGRSGYLQITYKY